MFTLESTVGDLLNHPIGNDVITMIREQINLPKIVIENMLVKSVKLRMLIKLSQGMVDETFLMMLCDLLNQPVGDLNGPVEWLDNDERMSASEIEDQDGFKKWWKEAVTYQIYPRSFKDGNHDGIGDLKGIIEKLDYLKDLGIDLIWLSPVYDSPNDDNGYDIRDYYQIMKEFGTMEDFDNLLEGVHSRGMRLIMDLVINHTSDEHEWFKQSKASKDSPYRDYYIWKDRQSDKDELPNNWISFFSGPTWNYYEETDSYGLHIFSQKQMDLNWEHEPMRQDVYKMIRYWLDKGIDGFRLDVINFISKVDGLPNGSQLVGDLMGHRGIEQYFYGPKLHHYLHEMHMETFANYDVVTVGETPGVGLRMSELLTHRHRRELDMVFNFDHLDMAGKTRQDDYVYDLNYYKQVLVKWQSELSEGSWNSLFTNNHDNPRMISKIDPEGRYRKPLGKLLATILLTLKGTPFIYQGQEFGLPNGVFHSIDDFEDVESINLYNEMIEQGSTLEETIKVLVNSTRDHSRLPMPWDDSPYHGFSTCEPWIKAQIADSSINSQSEAQDESSVLNYYKQLISLRKSTEVFVYGDVEFYKLKEKNYFAYYRKLTTEEGVETYFVEMNLSKIHRPSLADKQAELLMCNYKKTFKMLHPYECRIYKI